MLPHILLITGNMASGKSTVAQAVAQADALRFPRSVHLRGDIFRRMIVNGQAEMSFALSEEAQRQLTLRYKLACATALGYAQEGFFVVYQDIILGRALRAVVDMLSSVRMAVVVLCPKPEVIAAREAARPKTGYPDTPSIYAFDKILRAETPRIGYWLDNSDLTVEQTVDAIMKYLRDYAPTNPEA